VALVAKARILAPLEKAVPATLAFQKKWSSGSLIPPIAFGYLSGFTSARS
jgi:hypothetical protein